METMSNALGEIVSAGSSAVTRSAGVVPMKGPVPALLAAGVCTLAAWTFVRLLRPGKFLLRGVPGRPNNLHALHVLTVYLTYQIALSVARLAAAALQGVKLAPDGDAPSTVGLPAMGVGQLVLIAGALAVGAMTFRGGLVRGLGLTGRRWLSDTGRGVVGFLAALPLCWAAFILTCYLIQCGVLPIKLTEHPAIQFIREASLVWVVVVFAVTVVLAPIGEELFFRGLLQSLLRRYVGGPWPAVLITSAIFAAAHYPLLKDMPALFLLGVALGYNYERTGRLLGPILLHAIFNAVMLWHTLAQ